MRAFSGAVAIAFVCLAAGTTVLGQQAQPTAVPAGVVLSQDAFKSVQVLKDIPVDTFFESMGMFASSMGNDCTFCHVKEAYFDKTAFAQVTPRMQRARQML